jgi:hypothetical protein
VLLVTAVKRHKDRLKKRLVVTMSTKEANRDRVAELRREIGEAQGQVLKEGVFSADAFKVAFQVLADLRKYGIAKPRYNLDSPYGQGIFHCGERNRTT